MLRGNGADHDARRVHLRTRLKELDTEARNIAEAIRRGVLVDALAEQAQAIERERAEVGRRLKELDALTMPTAQVTADDVLRCWETLTETLRQGTAVDRKAVARAFVKELWAHPDTHVVEGRLYDPRLKVCGVLVAPRGIEPLLPA